MEEVNDTCSGAKSGLHDRAPDAGGARALGTRAFVRHASVGVCSTTVVIPGTWVMSLVPPCPRLGFPTFLPQTPIAAIILKCNDFNLENVFKN